MEVVRGLVEFGLDRLKARQRWSDMMGSDQFDFHRFLDNQSVHRCLYISRYGKAEVWSDSLCDGLGLDGLC